VFDSGFTISPGLMASLNNDADALSRETEATGCVRTREAGQAVPMGPSKASGTACAFRNSGTKQIQVRYRSKAEQVRHVFDCGEMPFPHLLPSGRLIQLHTLYGFRIVEVHRWWIIKRDVAIFAKFQKAEVYGLLIQKTAVAIRFSFRVNCVAVQMMRGGGMNDVGETHTQPAPETRGVRVGDSDVLLHMKNSYSSPLDIRALSQGVN